jgi:hypothetical protein
MHILTGMLVAALLNKKKGPGTKQHKPRFLGGPVEIAHSLPGRVRFYIPAIMKSDSAVAVLNERLGKVDAIDKLIVTPRTGSVLIRYRASEISEDLLLAALVRLLGLEKAFDQPPQPVIAKEMKHMGESLNRAVYEKTGGIVDLFSAVMILAGMVGIRKILSNPAASSA